MTFEPSICMISFCTTCGEAQKDQGYTPEQRAAMWKAGRPLFCAWCGNTFVLEETNMRLATEEEIEFLKREPDFVNVQNLFHTMQNIVKTIQH